MSAAVPPAEIAALAKAHSPKKMDADASEFLRTHSKLAVFRSGSAIAIRASRPASPNLSGTLALETFAELPLFLGPNHPAVRPRSLPVAASRIPS
jgi:hypothetical protein